MATEAEACAPGALLSSLIFKLKNAPGDAEGFLLGCVRRHAVESITDQHSSVTSEEKRTFIQSFVCFPGRYSFYDHYGRPDFGKIEELLGEQQKNVVGWFSYRRNSTHRISLREKAIHRRLKEAFPSIANRDFLFGLVTEEAEKSTVQSTEYSFHNWIGTSPQPVQVSIVNLRASTAVPYHTLPFTHLPPSLTHYSNVLREQRPSFQDSEGCMLQTQAIESLYRAMVAKLGPLQSELAQTTEAVVSLGEEVERLQEDVNSLQQAEKDILLQAEVVGDLIQIDDEIDSANDHSQLVQQPAPMMNNEPLMGPSGQMKMDQGAPGEVEPLTDLTGQIKFDEPLLEPVKMDKQATGSPSEVEVGKQPAEPPGESDKQPAEPPGESDKQPAEPPGEVETDIVMDNTAKQSVIELEDTPPSGDGGGLVLSNPMTETDSFSQGSQELF